MSGGSGKRNNLVIDFLPEEFVNNILLRLSIVWCIACFWCVCRSW
ncbi:hypothetical protein LINPERHAP1_LOCUS16242 [Linum perenne]